MQNTFLILEDNNDRTAEMRSQAATHRLSLDLEFFTDAPACIEWLAKHSSRISLISLDHDLEPLPGATGDPGTGRDVADWLALNTPQRPPVIIHSSNYEAAVGMEMELVDAGWTVERVVPYEDVSWIGEGWIKRVKEFLKLDPS